MIEGIVSRLKYRVFMIMTRRLLNCFEKGKKIVKREENEERQNNQTR